jgi:hypothetical protein
VNGELAQTICLAAFGSAWLAGPADRAPPPLEATSDNFQFVASLRFEMELGGEQDSVAAWLQDLRGRGIDRLWLVAGAPGRAVLGEAPVDERYLVAFAGAGSWFVLATGAAAATWRARWEVGDPHAPDRRIWNVTYRGRVLPRGAEPPRPPIEEAERTLRDALQAAADLAASRPEIAEWAGIFEGALNTTKPPDWLDLLPPDAYSADAQRLAATAAAGWVFGGMGSWNDFSFPDDKEFAARYDEVSENLYRAVLDALVTATNSDLTPA